MEAEKEQHKGKNGTLEMRWPPRSHHNMRGMCCYRCELYHPYSSCDAKYTKDMLYLIVDRVCENCRERDWYNK